MAKFAGKKKKRGSSSTAVPSLKSPKFKPPLLLPSTMTSSSSDSDDPPSSSSTASQSSLSESCLVGFVIANIVALRYYSERISGRELVVLVREPVNPFDPNALNTVTFRSALWNAPLPLSSSPPRLRPRLQPRSHRP